MNETIIRNISSLAVKEPGKKILNAVEETMGRLNPARIVRNFLSFFPEDIIPEDVRMIGFGKASAKMMAGALEILPEPVYAGIIIPNGMDQPDLPVKVQVLRGSHPILDSSSIESTRTILNRMKELTEESVVIVLISGGGSALLELPVNEISVQDFASVSKCVMNSGGSIGELNGIRYTMSQVKGGKLARFLYPARVTALIISDVPGDDISVIASGPLVPPDMPENVLRENIERFSALCPDLARVKDKLDLNLPESSDRIFRKVQNRIILKNSDFVDSIANILREDGSVVRVLYEPVTGDVRKVSEFFVETARTMYADLHRPFFLVAGGETTVTVHGNGIGGRNCQLSVMVSALFSRDEEFAFASLGTDGIDGVSPAMGGITDSAFRNRVTEKEVEASLDKNDTFTLLNKYMSAIISGFTGNNVSDIFICYYAGNSAPPGDGNKL
ncbi:MAG: DUF4147 domain-containing protein [Candidatus Thermoplasmatota archaeon]|jgi:glycerate 2-kinase|nr:DUF4147 domain-containing protein [Candidatus Thermoplasmatota archaeon]